MESTEFQTKYLLGKKRKEIKTFDDLTAFLKDVTEHYNIGYGDAPRAIAQAALATACFLSSEFGISGYQGGFVMWDFIKDWQYSDNKTGLRILDYDNMLYPQCADKFEKVISLDTWNHLQNVAKKKLTESTYAHPDVIAHWQSIVEGTVPFGYKVECE